MSKKQLRSTVSAGLTVLAIAFLIRSARGSGIGWDALTAVPIATGILVIAFFGAAVFTSGLLWSRLLRGLTDVRFSMADAAWAHVQSWLLKYVPGQVGAVAAKVMWGTERGIPRTRIAASFVYENLFYLLASFVVSLPTVLLLVNESRGRYGAVIALLLIVQVGILSLPRTLGPLLERRTGLRGIVLGAGDVLRQEGSYIAPRVLNGLGFVVLAAAVVNVSTVDDVLVLAAVYVLAGTLGTLAFLVPGGLGVREAVITALLAPRVGTGEALTLAASARLYATATDVVLLIAYLSIGRRQQIRAVDRCVVPDGSTDDPPVEEPLSEDNKERHS